MILSPMPPPSLYDKVPCGIRYNNYDLVYIFFNPDGRGYFTVYFILFPKLLLLVLSFIGLKTLGTFIKT